MVTVAELSKNFRDEAGVIEVIRGASFSLSKGEMVALVGASGAGKTTLLQILGGFDRASSGSVQIDGKELGSMRPRGLAEFRNRYLGFVFQFHYLLPDFTAVENVFLPGVIGGERPSRCRERALELLDAVGLSNRTSHYPSELSGGERQRVALARALYNSPALVLADEPTGNLDKTNSDRLLELFRKANRELRQTFLVATHNEYLARGMDRVVYLQDGKVMSSS
jgi:lipoprotein-releasing system ATP-binding protein